MILFKIFIIKSMVLIVCGQMSMSGHHGTSHSVVTKILIRIGILYDINNAYLLQDVKTALLNYPKTNGISDKYEIETRDIYQQTTENETQAILDSQVTAVFLVTRRINCTKFSDLFQKIPFFYISGSTKACDAKKDFNRLFYLYPADSTLMATMLVANRQYHWTSAAVLYEENDEVQFTFQDMQEARDVGIDILAFEATGGEDSIREKLIQARRKGSRTYILVCSYTRLLKIMTIARELRLSTSNNHWFIPNVLMNPHVLHDFLKDGVHITFLHSPLITPLTLKILGSDPSLNEDGHRLFVRIVKSLTRIATRSLVTACGKTNKNHPTYDEANGVCFSNIHGHGVTYKFCGADISKSVNVETHERRRRSAGHETKNDTDELEPNLNSSVTAVPPTTTVSRTTRVKFDESCIIYTFNETDINDNENGTVPVVSGAVSHGGHDHGRRKRETVSPSSHDTSGEEKTETHGDMGSVSEHGDGAESDGHSDEDSGGHQEGGHGAGQFEVAANFDPCPYESIYRWKYKPSTCSHTFMSHILPPDANAVFIIEHVHGETGAHELLAVGGYNGKRGQVSVTYPPFKISHITLPKTPFVLGVVWNPPWLYWKYDPETKVPVNDSYEGFLYDMILKLSSTMGFNFTIYEPSAIEFGENSNLTGGELEYKMNLLFDDDVCDMFLMAKTIHGGRILAENIVGLTTSFQQPKMYLLTKRVERDDNVSIWQFLTPFRDESWVMLYMSLLMTSLLMTYINKYNPNEFRKAARDMREGAKRSEHMGIMNSLWFNFASLVEQSSQLLPYSASMKVISGIWWYFVMLVVAAYTANMISFMTQSNNDGITTLEELVSQQEFEYGMLEDNPMLTKFLPEARDQPYSGMWDKIDGEREHTVPENLEEALEHVREGNFILIATYKELVQAITSSCVYDKVGDGFYKYQYGLPVPLGWQFLPLTNDYLQRLTDDGTITELESKWFGDLETRCETESQGTAEGQLDLKAFIGMYVLLILGVTAGIIVCIFETACIKYGGLGGMLGKAKRYEFRKNHIEHQKPDRVMEKEFENWTGGWEVQRHKPFFTISDALEKKYAHNRRTVDLDYEKNIVWKENPSGPFDFLLFKYQYMATILQILSLLPVKAHIDYRK